MKCELKTITSIDEIKKIRPIWEKYQWHPNSDIDYYIFETLNNPSVGSPFVFLGYENGEAKLLIVGRMVNERLPIRFGFSSLSFLKFKTVLIPSFGILINQAKSLDKLFLKKIIEKMKTGEFDIIKFGLLPDNSPLYDSLIKKTKKIMRSPSGFRQNSWKLSTKNGFNDFLLSHPKFIKTKKYLNNKLNRNFGNYDIRIYNRKNQICQIYKHIQYVYSKSWQKVNDKNNDGSFLSKREFEYGLASNRTKVYILFIQNKPVSFWFGQIYNKTFFLEKTSFDPAYQKYSVGTLLLMQLIEDSFLSADIEFLDFGFGNDQGKSLYCNLRRSFSTIYIYAPRILPILSNFVKTTIEFFHQKSKKIFQKYNIDRKLRRAYRKSLGST